MDLEVKKGRGGRTGAPKNKVMVMNDRAGRRILQSGMEGKIDGGLVG